jgi:hypothetical protein
LQHAGSTPAVAILPARDDVPERFFSFSESDRAEGLGKASERGCWGSPFDLWKHFECGGNFWVALERARTIAGNPRLHGEPRR